MSHADVTAGIDAALKVGSLDAAVIAVEARRATETGTGSAAVVIPIGEGLHRFDRPKPSLTHYDQLLETQ